MLTLLNPAHSVDPLGLFLTILLLSLHFYPCFDFFVVVVYKCSIFIDFFILLSLLESGFIFNSVLHTGKNPSSLDVIHKFDVCSHPLTKVSHRT